ncbi:unnamed protein product [Sphagnum jensenii]|uniref:DNA-directed RNA polymerase subunit n=1 Tax=Sphagnum jensenii TaxID=128206 RepID=A0ABP0VEQ9_9BRYO
MSKAKSSRFREVVKLTKGTTKTTRKCHYCNTVHPQTKKPEGNPLGIIANIVEDGKSQSIEPDILLPHQIKQIFDKVLPSTVEKLGLPYHAHPRNLILTVVKVPPVTLRPEIRIPGMSNKGNIDGITMGFQALMKQNAFIEIPAGKPTDAEIATINEFNQTYYSIIKPLPKKVNVRAGPEAKALSLMIKSKQSIQRKNLLGKRTRNGGRSTISHNQLLHPGEIAIPLSTARKLLYTETVQDYNKIRLGSLVANGNQYPGVAKVFKKSDQREYFVSSNSNIILENGDVVYRHMISGDILEFNRAPSLTMSSITSMIARVVENPNINTYGMNVLICKLFNADFDGDAMSIYVNQSEHSRSELHDISSIKNVFIGHADGLPAIGQTYDSILGLFELTKTGVQLSAYQCMRLFQNCRVMPLIATHDKSGKVASYSGRDVIGLILGDIAVNLSGRPTYYQKALEHIIYYNPDDIFLEIKNGRLVRGVLDKKYVADGALNGLYHIIANEYGFERAIDILFDMQQVAINYIAGFGATIGLEDLLISAESKREINTIVSELVLKSSLLTDQLNLGNIVAPIGKTVDEFYEAQQIELLSVFDDFNEPIMKSIDPNSNNLFKLVSSGAKGKMEHLVSMVSLSGQIAMNGERIRENFGFKRTLSYFRRFETDPGARGYIFNSFVSGLTMPEFIWNAAKARVDIIIKALSTAETGEQNRKSIKNLESIIINNYRWAMKDRNIIQLVYGGNYIDPRETIGVKFNTVFLNDADLKSKYQYDGKGAIFEAEFARIKADRDKYREVFLPFESYEFSHLLTADRILPIDPERLMTNKINKLSEEASKPSSQDLVAMVEAVHEFTSNFHYCIFHPSAKTKKREIPDFVIETVWLMCMSVRATFCARNLEARGVSPRMLSEMLDEINIKYIKSLIAPGTAAGNIAAQSFSEPLTQMMLDAHHKSALGGTNKSMMIKIKGILNAKHVPSILMATSCIITPAANVIKSKSLVQELANNIESLHFNRFVCSYQVFFEKYGEITHPDYKHETKMITDFARMNTIKAPGNLLPWCVRIELNKSTLLLKNIALEYIILQLRAVHPDLYFVYTPENAKKLILRVYIRNTAFRKRVECDGIVALVEVLLQTVLRGVRNILNTEVVKLSRNVIDKSGSIVADEGSFGIRTTGTNLAQLLHNPLIDAKKTITDAIQEISAVLGIEAARTKIILELKNLVGKCGYGHLSIYADEMTYTGFVTGIERGGLTSREASNTLLRMGFSSPIQALESIVMKNSEERVTGVTGALMCAKVPCVGTIYNRVVINEEFVRKHMKTVGEAIDQL